MLTWDDIRYLVVHASATQPRLWNYGAAEINAAHLKRGWIEIGYHFVIKRNGGLEFGRDLNKRGAHVLGHNHHAWGICLIGGVSNATGEAENNYTPLQFQTLRGVLRSLSKMAPNAEIVGHRDFSPDRDGDGVIEPWEWLKECPCFDVRAWVKEQGL